MSNRTVFVSATTSEFQAEREALAASLRKAGYTVIFHNELRYGAPTLLRDLEADILRAGTAICLIGDHSGGGFPSASEAAPYDPPPHGTRASYTQWEFLLARKHGLRQLVYLPTGARPSPGPDDDPALQAAFNAWLPATGIARLPFSNADALCARVLEQLNEINHPTGPVIHGLAPSLGHLFVGRDAFLTELRASLTAGGGTAITAAIQGMGGIGKTRAATEYAWAHQADYPDALLLIPAETGESLTTHLGNLTAPLGIPRMEDQSADTRRAAAVAWLAARQGWLLILDHVDTQDGMDAAHALRGALPHGHVLLTSRLGEAPDGFRALHLGVLSPEAAADLVLERTNGKRALMPDDRAQAEALGKDVGHLALALTHAAAYIARHALSVAAYRAELASAFGRVADFRGKTVSDYERSTLATLTLSLERATPEGRALLERLAFLADEPVPRFLLEVPVPGAESEDAREAEADLYGYSLVTRDRTAGAFSVHRLVRAVVRLGLADAEARVRLEQALGWVNRAFVGDPQDARTWPRLMPLAEHAEAVADRAVAAGIDEPTGGLMGHLGVLFDVRAQYNRAERLKRAALAIGERSLGTDHPEVATRRNNLASLLQATNRLAEAEPLYRRALAITEASLGPDHPDVATRLNNLAGLLLATNRPTEAEPMFRRALAITEASLGPDHPTVATRLNNLAGLLQATNRLAEAEPMFRRALDIDEATLGPDHPTVATRLNNLACLLEATNRLAEAEPLYRRALAIDEAGLGPDHPSVATSLNNLAGLLRTTNRLAEAEPMYRRALAIDETSLGPDHPTVATRLNNLAALLEATNRLAEAEPMFRRALDIDEASLGPDHPTVASHLSNLAALLEATNRLAEAEPMFRRALAIDEASLGPDHPDVARDLNNLAGLLRATNRLAEAEPMFRRGLLILAHFHVTTRHRHPNFEAGVNNYAGALQEMGLTEAEITAELQAIAREARQG